MDRTSERLVVGETYSRADLKAMFGITDATINNGTFRPKGTSSLWLFITEEKGSDRTQYRDKLNGDLLHWDGQTKGRTDPLVIEHRERGLELLVFYRRFKAEHPGYAFRYLGPFQYVSHMGSEPTQFVLHRGSLLRPLVAADVGDPEPFAPDDLEDARDRVAKTIVARRGQQAFRNALIAAYGGRCAISGCSVLDVLEAAHIVAYRGSQTNVPANGILLRSDLHTLFDCGLISVDAATMTVVVADALRQSEYGTLAGATLQLPTDVTRRPAVSALEHHRAAAGLAR